MVKYSPDNGSQSASLGAPFGLSIEIDFTENTFVGFHFASTRATYRCDSAFWSLMHFI